MILGIFDPEKVAAGSHEEWKSLKFSNYWYVSILCFPIEFSNDVCYIQLAKKRLMCSSSPMKLMLCLWHLETKSGEMHQGIEGIPWLFWY